jgi:feruloyl-CoA synthase
MKPSPASLFDNPALLAPALTLRSDLPDGSIVLRSPQPLLPYARCIGEWVEHWARETPDALALAEREAGGGWRRLSWGGLRQAIGRLAQGLLDLDLPPAKPIVILSDNAVDHALLMLAAMHIGRAVCSVSSAYSRPGRDVSKLRSILDALDPALVYADDAAVHGPAVVACGLQAIRVFGQGAAGVPGALSFDALLQAAEGPGVMQAFAAIAPDDTAKYLLTSGSTGSPKVVVNSHRMLCANQQMIAQAWRFLEHERPVVVDWLPWSHTFGGNHNLNLVLRNGGSLYIDEGRPAPGLIEQTVRNLREVQPNMIFNVPRGFDMLLPFLEADPALARQVLGGLRLAFYAAAALPSATWTRLEKVAASVRDEPLWLTTSWGATETAPAVTSVHWRLDRPGCIGIPLPGLSLKLVPNGQKRELRVKGVSVFSHYRNAPALSAAAFDDDGYYRIGDAGLLIDDARPEHGVAFDGRIAEDFKLSSGTWVSVGTVRLKLVSACSPWVQDAVITGHDREHLGVLLFPSAAAQQLAPAALAERLTQALRTLQAEGGGSSQCPARLLVLAEPPSADAGEITDKGYINQRAVLDRRAAEVELLHAQPLHPRVLHTG